jgi:hypothetical protein
MRPLALLLLAAGGCAFEPGGWFATVSPSLNAGYLTRADREAGGGWQKLNTDYQVSVRRASMRLGEIGLLATSGGGGPTTFDPAHPPPGYSLCHNGHCHSSDGRLVSYAEIQAQLGGGAGGGLQPVITLAAPDALDLLAAAERPLTCEPSCNLDRTRIVRVRAPVQVLALEGKVRDGRTPPRLAETPFRWEIADPARAPLLETELDLSADRDHPPAVTLRLDLALGAALLDDVDFAALTPSAGTLDLTAPANPAADERILMNLAEQSLLSASISRGENP